MNWSITKLIVEPSYGNRNNIVVYVSWKVQSGAATQYGRTGLVPSSNEFVAFENLTESMVLNWVWAAIDKQAIEASVAAMLKPAAPVTAITKQLPWVVA